MIRIFSSRNHFTQCQVLRKHPTATACSIFTVSRTVTWGNVQSSCTWPAGLICFPRIAAKPSAQRHTSWSFAWTTYAESTALWRGWTSAWGMLYGPIGQVLPRSMQSAKGLGIGLLFSGMLWYIGCWGGLIKNYCLLAEFIWIWEFLENLSRPLEWGKLRMQPINIWMRRNTDS